MYPVGEEEIYEIYHRADAPGYWVGPIYVADLAEDTHDDGDIRHSQHAPDREHDEHGHKGLARAAADRRHGVREGEQEVKQRGCSGLLHAVGDDAGVVVEDADEGGGEDVVYDADDLGEDDGGDDAEARALFARSYFCAPRFWLMKVVMAMLKLVMGMKAKPSILDCEP